MHDTVYLYDHRLRKNLRICVEESESSCLAIKHQIQANILNSISPTWHRTSTFLRLVPGPFVWSAITLTDLMLEEYSIRSYVLKFLDEGDVRDFTSEAKVCVCWMRPDATYTRQNKK